MKQPYEIDREQVYGVRIPLIVNSDSGRNVSTWWRPIPDASDCPLLLMCAQREAFSRFAFAVCAETHLEFQPMRGTEETIQESIRKKAACSIESFFTGSEEDLMSELKRVSREQIFISRWRPSKVESNFGYPAKDITKSRSFVVD